MTSKLPSSASASIQSGLDKAYANKVRRGRKTYYATIRQFSRTEAEKARKTAQADLEQLVAQNAEPCVTECAARWGVDKGTASKWISDFVRDAPMRKIQRGKRKVVVAHPRLKIVESS
jgi:hypothetical protein